MRDWIKRDGILYLLLLFGLLLILASALRTNFWGDELYSMVLARRSYVDIWEITGADVHPPLYYWGLRTFSLIFGETVLSYRTFSGLSMLATLLLVFPIKKHFNRKTAITFLATVIFTPVLQFTSSEIRMYGWVIFFTAGAALYAYIAFDKQTKKKYWFTFALFSTCICYTQYFGAVTLFFFYLYFTAYTYFVKKHLVKYIIYCGLFVTICYIPWIPYVISQLGTVSNEYWIIDSMIDWEKYIFYPIMAKTIPFEGTGYIVLRWAFLLCIVSSISSAILTKIIRDKNKNKIYFALICILSYLSLLTFAYTLSKIHRPLFIDKYSLCALGFLWIGLTLIISSFDLKKVFSKVFILLFLIIAIISTGFRFRSEYYYSNYINNRDKSISNYLDQNIKEGDALLGFEPQGIYITTWLFNYPNLNGFLFKRSAIEPAENPQIIKSIDEIDSRYKRLFAIGLDHWQKDIINFDSYKNTNRLFEVKHEHITPNGDIIQIWERRE